MIARYILTLVCILGSLQASAIRPEKNYPVTPDKAGVSHEELEIVTPDGAQLNVWHLVPEESGYPVIISQSDAGNMGYWLYLGMYLQVAGFDVWLYDYRGFGGSSAFEIDNSRLFYNEYVTDLASVVEHVYRKTSVPPVLMGISMGSIIVNEYLKDTRIPVTHLIFDGYVADPGEWISRLADAGKEVTLPEGYVPEKYRNRRQKILYMVGSGDKFSTLGDIPLRHSRKTTVKVFESGHISAFSDYPEEYVSAIIEFVLSSL